MSSICLLAILGTGIMCSGGDKKQPVVVSDFCEAAGPQIKKFNKLTAAEKATLTRQRKEAIVTLRTDFVRLCK